MSNGSFSPLEGLITLLPGVYFVQRPDFTIAHATSRLEEFTGLALEEFSRTPEVFWSLFDAHEREQHKHEVEQAVHARKRLTSTLTLLDRTHNQRHALREVREPLVNHAGELVEFRVLWLKEVPGGLDPQALRSSNWNRTFGALTLGFAHDLNNLLTGLLCSSEALLTQTDATHPWHKILDRILTNSQKASQLLQQLSQLHTVRLGQLMYHDLNELARRAADAGRRVVPKRIEFELALDPATLPIHTDGAELLQVLLGVVIGAGELVSKGKLVFRTSSSEALPPSIVSQQAKLTGGANPCFILQAGPVASPPEVNSTFAERPTPPEPGMPALSLALFQAVQFAERNGGYVSTSSGPPEFQFRLWLPQATFGESTAVPKTAGP
jgi:nitrogen-specific signal transduction histidine kinase